MTPEELRAIRARANAATEGPWIRHEYYGDICGPDGEELFYGINDDGTVWASELDDAIFATHARTDIPALLDLVDNLEKGREIERRMLRNAATRMEAVRALHGYYTDQSGKKWCDHCSVHVGYERFEPRPWPCPSIQALDGDL